MKKLNAGYILLLTVFLAGCTTTQKINKLDAGLGKVNLVCIVEHKAVRTTVLEVIQEGLSKHNVKYRVIPGTYENSNNLWIPTLQEDQVKACDALLFYVANWSWDIAMYMRFANIWMTTPDRKRQLGVATYDARASLNKFISAREKLLELMDGLFEQYKNPNLLQQGEILPVPAPAPATTVSPSTDVPTISIPATVVKPNDPATSSTSQKLRELQALKKDGLITEEEYQLKKKQLLDKF